MDRPSQHPVADQRRNAEQHEAGGEEDENLGHATHGHGHPSLLHLIEGYCGEFLGYSMRRITFP